MYHLDSGLAVPSFSSESPGFKAWCAEFLQCIIWIQGCVYRASPVNLLDSRLVVLIFFSKSPGFKARCAKLIQ